VHSEHLCPLPGKALIFNARLTPHHEGKDHTMRTFFVILALATVFAISGEASASVGDGIRRNVATISQEERNRLRDAFIELHRRLYPDGVSYWFKQDQIHQATHVHSFPPYEGIAFLPWHRELVNRLEALLREIDPTLSLHYWDWMTDPTHSPDGRGGFVNLFSLDFMGAANGPAGEPWLNAGFYDPMTLQHRDATGNPADPPRDLSRAVGQDPRVTNPDGTPNLGISDSAIISAATYPEMRRLLESAHNAAHEYIGGTIRDAHIAFRDPFVFLLHSNTDRLFALWQLQAGEAWRLDPEQVYGAESNTDVDPGLPIYDPGILTLMDPWAGDPNNHPEVQSIRPWAPPENEQLRPENQKNSKHPLVVNPPFYDTNPAPFTVEHLAGQSPTGDLLVFFWSPRADWQVVNVSAITGQQIAGPVTSWLTQDG
jgi:hypothetical protein